MGDRIADARSGDLEAWKSLYEEHAGSVLRLGLAFAEFPPEHLERVIEESFVRAFSVPEESMRSERYFRLWILAMGRLLYIRSLAKSGAAPATMDIFPAMTDGADADGSSSVPKLVVDRIDPEVLREKTAELIANPPEPGRETVRLFYVDGSLSAQDIASLEKAPGATITSHLERVRGELKRRVLVHGAQGLEIGAHYPPHLDEGRWSALMDGTLDPDDHGRTIRHLESGCNLCEYFLMTFHERHRVDPLDPVVDEALLNLSAKTEPFDEEGFARVVRTIRGEEEEPQQAGNPWVTPMLVAAVVVFIVIALSFLLFS